MTDNTQYTDINRGNNDVTPEGVLAEQSEVLLDDSQRATGWHEDANQEWEEREARNELKHVAGLGELQDVTEVEYRKVRLERVVLVGVWSSAVTTQAKAEESLRELAALAETAGAVVCDGLLQHRSKPDAATYVGSGKAKEIAGIVAREEADTIIVDDDLPPSQRRALEDAAKVKVVDRTAVRRRWSWRSSNTCCPDCVVGVVRCPVRPAVARPARMRASDREARARPKSKWTVV